MERIIEGQIFPTDPTIPESSSYHQILKRLPILAGPLTAAGLLLSSTPAFAEQPKTPTNPTTPNNSYLPFSRNILTNGDFSLGSSGWQNKATSEGAQLLIDNHAGIDHSAAACAFIGLNSTGSNKTEWYQDLAVRKNTLYRLRGGIATQTVNPSSQDGHGAYLAVEGSSRYGYPNQAKTNEVVGTTQPTYVSLETFFFSGNSTEARVSIEQGPAQPFSVACGDNISLSPL